VDQKLKKARERARASREAQWQKAQDDRLLGEAEAEARRQQSIDRNLPPPTQALTRWYTMMAGGLPVKAAARTAQPLPAADSKSKPKPDGQGQAKGTPKPKPSRDRDPRQNQNRARSRKLGAGAAATTTSAAWAAPRDRDPRSGRQQPTRQQRLQKQQKKNAGMMLAAGGAISGASSVSTSAESAAAPQLLPTDPRLLSRVHQQQQACAPLRSFQEVVLAAIKQNSADHCGASALVRQQAKQHGISPEMLAQTMTFVDPTKKSDSKSTKKKAAAGVGGGELDTAPGGSRGRDKRADGAAAEATQEEEAPQPTRKRGVKARLSFLSPGAQPGSHTHGKLLRAAERVRSHLQKRYGSGGKAFASAVAKTFRYYDADGSNTLDMRELRQVRGASALCA
jgi:hypothetical protein